MDNTVYAPWDEETAKRERNIAHALLSRHDHDWTFCGRTRAEKREDENLTRSNCGACVLNGYQDRDDDEHKPADGPNYAGWARVFVEAGRSIPATWAEAFVREFTDNDNERYVEALKRDVATFGMPHVDGLKVEPVVSGLESKGDTFKYGVRIGDLFIFTGESFEHANSAACAVHAARPHGIVNPKTLAEI